MLLELLNPAVELVRAGHQLAAVDASPRGLGDLTVCVHLGASIVPAPAPRTILCTVAELTIDTAPPNRLGRWLASRWRLAYFTAFFGLLLYGGRAIMQMLLLSQETVYSDFPEFYSAAVQLNRAGDPYAAFLSACPGHEWCKGGYIYPPLFAELLRPLALLSQLAAERAWILVSHLLLVATAVIVYLTVRRWLVRGTAPMLLAASLFFLPVYQNLAAGQIGALLLMVLALAAYAFVERGASTGAGLALGVGAVLRVTPVALAPLLLRGRRDLRRPVGLLMMAATGAGLLGLLYLLTPTTLEYFTRVLPRLTAGTGDQGNVSLPGVLIRLQLLTLGHTLPYWGAITTVMTVAGVAITWWFSRGEGDGRYRAATFAAYVAVLPVVSSITWNYHLINELLVYALLAPSLLAGRRAWWLAVASYPLLWIYGDRSFLAMGIDPNTPAGAIIFLCLTSANALGAILLWVSCLDVLRGQPRA